MNSLHNPNNLPRSQSSDYMSGPDGGPHGLPVGHHPHQVQRAYYYRDPNLMTGSAGSNPGIKDIFSGVVTPLYKGLTSSNRQIRCLAFELINIMLPYSNEVFICGSVLTEKNVIDEDILFQEHLLKEEAQRQNSGNSGSRKYSQNSHGSKNENKDASGKDLSSSENSAVDDRLESRANEARNAYNTYRSMNSNMSTLNKNFKRDSVFQEYENKCKDQLDEEKINFYNTFCLMTFALLPTLLMSFGQSSKPESVVDRARTILKQAETICLRSDVTTKLRENLNRLIHNLNYYINNNDEPNPHEHHDENKLIKRKKDWIGVIVKALHEAIPNTFPRIIGLLVSFFVDTSSQSSSGPRVISPNNNPTGILNSNFDNVNDENTEIICYINCVLLILEQLVVHSKSTYSDIDRQDLYAKNLAVHLVDPVVKLNSKPVFTNSCQSLLHSLLRECSDMAVIGKMQMSEYLTPLGHAQKQSLPGLQIAFEIQSTSSHRQIGMSNVIQEEKGKNAGRGEDGLIRNDSRNCSMKRQKSFRGLGIRKAKWNRPLAAQKRVRAKFANIRQFLFSTTSTKLISDNPNINKNFNDVHSIEPNSNVVISNVRHRDSLTSQLSSEDSDESTLESNSDVSSDKSSNISDHTTNTQKSTQYNGDGHHSNGGGRHSRRNDSLAMSDMVGQVNGYFGFLEANENDDFVDGQYDDQEAMHYSSEDGETSHTLSRSHTVSKTVMGSESTGLGVEIY